ncbi:PilX N-terminal domain-containing pilus assembly protein [Pseudomonas sp. NPDC086581]|uniref:pilus assembly PilX family protein n=1 Tax=Pseudomonas sp. NPDC086581 TaxID=3364432 RepID=UPI003828621E
MTSSKTQRGMALLVSLVLLLILTVLAIAMASNSTMQQRISANAQQQNIAFQAAESGLQFWVNRFAQSGVAPTNGTSIAVEPTSGSSGSAQVNLNASFIECAKFIPAQSLSVAAGTLSYTCYQVSSQAKACKNLSSCNVTTSDGQARALHRRSYIQATHL